jgi:hypothetical protein
MNEGSGVRGFEETGPSAKAFSREKHNLRMVRMVSGGEQALFILG